MTVKLHVNFQKTAGEILPKITLSEIKYLVFGIYSADFHVHLYAYIQNNLVGSAAVRGMDDYLLHYKAPKKKSSFMSGSRMVTYHSLPTYIRNAIDHPDDTLVYTETELKQSTDWMLDHIKKSNLVKSPSNGRSTRHNRSIKQAILQFSPLDIFLARHSSQLFRPRSPTSHTYT